MAGSLSDGGMREWLLLLVVDCKVIADEGRDGQ